MGKIRSMQAMRAIAAWMVVVGHLTAFMPFTFREYPLPTVTLAWVTTLANSGVDVFFCISGAIIYMIVSRPSSGGLLNEVADFCIKRFLRIYPILWIAIAIKASLGLPLLFTSWSDVISGLSLLIPPTSYQPAWTLTFEVRFYLLSAIVIFAARNRKAEGFAVLSALIAAAVFFRSTVAPSTWIVTQSLMLEFVFGLAVGAAYSSRLVIAPASLLAVGVAWFAATLIFISTKGIPVDLYRVAGFGVPSALILYGAMTLERAGRLKVPEIMDTLGDASYSTYLFHYTVIEYVAKRLYSSGPWGLAAFLSLSVVVTLIVSLISFRLIERPMMWVARHIGPRRAMLAARVVPHPAR